MKASADNGFAFVSVVLPGIEWIGWKAYKYYVLVLAQIFGEEAVKQFHFKSE